MKKPVNEGQMKGEGAPEKFGQPVSPMPNPIEKMAGTKNDIGEKSGFITDGYIDKKGTPYGEAAKFNFLPPGMEIENQENVDINAMPMKKVVAESYPGDGWGPVGNAAG